MGEDAGGRELHQARRRGAAKAIVGSSAPIVGLECLQAAITVYTEVTALRSSSWGSASRATASSADPTRHCQSLVYGITEGRNDDHLSK
ncbi:hypothetical protein PGT21_019453 [Puccinia graminis f. sp. tritici]|uniref:Uncharacterized protein n=1 Tax=Puccinia graminis f. sp. tritici TaxID=56615 RepID=A0A5B0PLJ9_PUCGR|nr:hypothetical protein PGT21_019453 [Puccinia graminis f. sp. tritici]